MGIKEILSNALRRIGREDAAASVEAGASPSGEAGEVCKTLLYCVNAAEKELAAYYFPLMCTETVMPSGGRIPFSGLKHLPYKIMSLKRGGKEESFGVGKGYLVAGDGEAELTYRYLPETKTADGESEFSGCGDGFLSALGAVAEYYTVTGEPALAEMWENRYREAVDLAQRAARSPLYIPPRRWV